jgi:potassium-transporting ATPase KdpC subunit
MSIVQEISRAVRVTLVLWVLTAIVYPLAVLALGQGLFPSQANGSLLRNAQGVVVGSSLIGQPFGGDRYFHGRPSTTQYSSANTPQDPMLKTGISGASNFAPSNPALLDRIAGDAPATNPGEISRLKGLGIQPTADLVYASGSGVDPHITVEAARNQVTKMAQARGLSIQQLEDLIRQNTDDRALGIFGEPGVNVLKLNLALDRIKP